jgi:hypothetical protein
LKKLFVFIFFTMPGLEFWLQHGDVVRLLDDRLGTIKFIGVINNHALPNMRANMPFVSYGLELDEPFEYGNNGSLDGIRYFVAKERCGLFTTRDNIKENIHAQFRQGERLKNWRRDVKLAERPIKRELCTSSPVTIKPSVVERPNKVNQNPSIGISIADGLAVRTSETMDVTLPAAPASPVLSSVPVNISILDEPLALNPSWQEVAIDNLDSVDVGPTVNPLNRSKPTEMFVETDHPIEMKSESQWQSDPAEMSVIIEPDTVNKKGSCESLVWNGEPCGISLERSATDLVQQLQASDASHNGRTSSSSQSKSTEVIVDSNQSIEGNEQATIDLSKPAEVSVVSTQPIDMQELSDQDTFDEVDTVDFFSHEVQPNDVGQNIKPIPCIRDDSGVVVNSIEPMRISPPNNQVLLNRSLPNEVFVAGVQHNDENTVSGPVDLNQNTTNEDFVEDVVPSAHDEPVQLSVLSIEKNISPSLISVNIKPVDADDLLFDETATPKVLTGTLEVETNEECGKVAEDDIISDPHFDEGVFDRMVKLAVEGSGAKVDQEVVKANVSKLLRNLGYTTATNITSDDENSELSDIEGDGVYNGLEADDSSGSTDYGDLRTDTIQCFSQLDDDGVDSEEGIFSGNTKYDEDLLENMGMVKFEKINYTSLRHHSHKLSQNYVNLPSFSSVINESKRSNGNQKSLDLTKPQSRRIASEPVIKVTNLDSPEPEDAYYEDEEEKELKIEDDSHDIDDKAKRLDIIDEQMKSLGEELTELTNESFKVLLDMDTANDEDSGKLEKTYLKIELKSMELRNKKTALDKERQELVDAVQNMMFANLDIMSPSTNNGLSGLDESTFDIKEDEEMITSPPI